MQILPKVFGSLFVTSILLAAGCHAQVPPSGQGLTPELARRVEILIRQRTKITPSDTISINRRYPSDMPGYDKIDVVITSGSEKYPPTTFLLSKDGKTLAQFNTYDISKDPKSLVSGAGRPSRGGPPSAPVEIVLFDDLECPFCARMHQELFPALLDRYGAKVRVEYRDFPLAQHPWAMRAAIDTNCVAAQSTAGYWNLVDYIHAHAGELGGEEKSIAKANESLDQMSRDEATKQHLDSQQLAKVETCLKKQDDSDIKSSVKLGESLDIAATPVLYINGEKLEGAYPLQDVFRMVDGALAAEGIAPPSSYVLPLPAKAGN